MFFINIYNLKKEKDILMLWSAYLCYKKLKQQNTGGKTVHALCELHLHSFRDKLLYDIDYVQVSKVTYYKH